MTIESSNEHHSESQLNNPIPLSFCSGFFLRPFSLCRRDIFPREVNLTVHLTDNAGWMAAVRVQRPQCVRATHFTGGAVEARKEPTAQIRISGSKFIRMKGQAAEANPKAQPGGLSADVRRILEAMPSGVHVFGLQRNGKLVLTWANRESSRILGEDCQRFVGMTLDEIFPQFAGTEVPKRYEAAAREGRSWFSNQLFFDNERFEGAYEVSVFQVETNLVAVSFRDISEKKASEFKEEQTRKELEDKVHIRTQDLEMANQNLKRVLADRSDAEMSVRQRLAMERLVTQLALRFINIPSDDVDHHIDLAISEIGEFTKVDRVYMFRFTDDRARMDPTHWWCAPGVIPYRGLSEGLRAMDFSWWTRKMMEGKAVHIPSVDKMAPEAAAERQFLKAQTIQSMLVVPLQYAGKPLGFLSLDSVRHSVEWTREDTAIVTAIGTIMVNAIERGKAERQLREQAIRDPLTELFNHRHVLDRLAEEFEKSDEHGSPLTICIGDFDDFKAINDQHGHQTGDEVLLKFSQLLSRELQGRNFAGRCGGDEFLIVFPNTTGLGARMIIENIRRQQQQIRFQGQEGVEFAASVTFGMAEKSRETGRPEVLFSKADEALYASKNAVHKYRGSEKQEEPTVNPIPGSQGTSTGQPKVTR